VPQWSFACSRFDGCQHFRQLFSNRLVWESNHPIAGRGEDRLSFGVPILLLRMNLTVQLDYEATLGTAEVDDERTDWVLSAELQSIQSPSAQFFP